MRRGVGGGGWAIGAAAALCLAVPSAAAAAPIASLGKPPTFAPFRGAPVKARPLPPRRVTVSPQNPFMAAGSNGNIHNDTWMTDAYQRPGPLGKALVAYSQSQPLTLCGSITFDSAGRIVTTCPSAALPTQVRIIDPATLESIATYNLPAAADTPGTRIYQNFTSGGYFFLDAEDRVWVSTKTDHLFVIKDTGTEQVLEHDYDLSGVLDTATERISSALPDFTGRIWFVSKKNGAVGTLDPDTGKIAVIRLGEEIENSFAVARNGVYIVSDKSMYRFTAGPDGKPRVVWKSTYPNSGIVKPSQVDAGSGTTPTIMKGGYVAITDNADPMDVVVYRNAAKLGQGEHRVVCTEPVFEHGASATENSLLTAGRSLIVENNYGYQNPLGLTAGRLTEPGFARVDIDRDGSGCHTVWTNRDARAPTVVPKLSTATGLIYTYTRDADPNGSESYYWTAIDFRSGKTVWQQYAGSGISYNNNYAGLALGPDGTAYLGTFGGLLSLRDGA
jgi:hypothetical protein